MNVALGSPEDVSFQYQLTQMMKSTALTVNDRFNKLFTCPEDQQPFDNQYWFVHGSYSPNNQVCIYCTATTPNLPRGPRPFRANQCRYPSELCIMLDSSYFTFAPSPSLSAAWNTSIDEITSIQLRARHNHGLNMLMLDGHVEWAALPMKAAKDQPRRWITTGSAADPWEQLIP
jgi:prepilin-type processing-associated H-X9-DG protein